MGTLNAIYVCASEPSTAKVLSAEYPSAYTETGTQFFAIDQPRDRFECPEPELESLSARLKTDVIWLSFQSTVDAFQYYHWKNGKIIRSLVYGCFEHEREWERVEGIPQEWEASVIFGDLTQALKYCHTENARSELERIYKARILEPGASVPSLDSRETARGVAEFFHFPGWS